MSDVPDVIAVLATVAGRVQGVGFRMATLRVGRELGVSGWVRNRPDGTVEALVQGAAADVDAFLQWFRRGPTGARVTSATVEAAPVDERVSGFRIA